MQPLLWVMKTCKISKDLDPWRQLKKEILFQRFRWFSVSSDYVPVCKVSVWAHFWLKMQTIKDCGDLGGQTGASPICFQAFHFVSHLSSCIPLKTPLTSLRKRSCKAANLVPSSTVMSAAWYTQANSASPHMNPGYLRHSHLTPDLSIHANLFLTVTLKTPYDSKADFWQKSQATMSHFPPFSTSSSSNR